jgi:hypothetical protein
VHNDLHARNIMIDENHNPLIFDWDRSYSVNLGANPQLSDDLCRGLCKISHCNKFLEDGRPIDLLKILQSTILDNGDPVMLYNVLQSMKIKNIYILYKGRRIQKYELIYNLLKSFNKWYSDEVSKCSLIYRDELPPDLNLLIDLLGRSYPIMIERLNNNYQELVTSFAFTDVADPQESFSGNTIKDNLKDISLKDFNYRYIENILS